MTLRGGPLDGSELPSRPEEFCMVSFYNVPMRGKASRVAVYAQRPDSWEYDADASREANEGYDQRMKENP